MTYRGIEDIVITTISSIVTLILVYVFNKYIKQIWNAKNDKQAKTKAKILFAAKYLAILIIIVLAWVFVPLSKFFVFFISLLFSFIVVMLVYDYSIMTLKSVAADQKREQREQEHRTRCNELYHKLLNTDKSEKEKRRKIAEELKKNDCVEEWVHLR